MLGRLEDCDAIGSLEVLIFLLFGLFGDAVSHFSVQSLLDLISDLDDLAILYDALWQLLQKLLLGRRLEVPIHLRLKRDNGLL